MKSLLVLLLLIPSLSWGSTFKNGKVVSGNSDGVNDYGGRFELPVCISGAIVKER